MLVSLALLLSPALAAPAPQAEDLATLLLRTGQPIPGLDASFRLSLLGTPSAGRGGGWLAVARASAQPVGSVQVLVGQRAADINGPLQLLRQPELLHGIQQDGFGAASMANDAVAYTARSFENGAVRWHAWREDQLLVRGGRPIDGAPQWTWRNLGSTENTTSGQVYVTGGADDPVGVSRQVIWRWPSEQLVLATGDLVPGLTQPIVSFDAAPTFSPDGSRWSQRVTVAQSGRRALVLDGAAYELDGLPVAEGGPVPATLSGASGGSTWLTLNSRLFLNDRGDSAFEATIRDASGEERRAWIRNGRIFASPPGSGSILGIDARGAVVVQRLTSFRLHIVEGYTNLVMDLDVDLDGDGVADPISSDQMTAIDVLSPNEQNLTVLRGRYVSESGIFRVGYFTARAFRSDVPVCEGVDNSSGTPAQLIACGSGRVADNEVSLRLFGLPTSAAGYVLASRDTGLVVGPGGSEGNLCLAGDIGRLNQQIFATDATGRAAVPFDLTAIPLPVGTAAAVAGERWYVQAWYRDTNLGMATSNFTSASALQFL